MNKKSFRIRTLTPIWTGGTDRDSNKVHETSIIGSLRWWYEGIIRGMGGNACDPTNDPCPKDEKKPVRCSACELFGCTGWSRKFRLEIRNINAIPLFFVANSNAYLANGNWLFRTFGGQDSGGGKTGKGLDTKFAFGVKNLWGEDPFDLMVTPLRGKGQDVIDIFSYLLRFVTTYGGIGAKTQNGFGQVKVVDGLNEESIERGGILIQKDIKQKMVEHGVKKGLGSTFNIKNLFSNLYRIETTQYLSSGRLIGEAPPNFDYRRHFIPCAFDVRYKSSAKNPFTGQGRDFGMRPFFIGRFKAKANSLLGETRGRSDQDRSASKIHVSHLFYDSASQQYRLKVWGYVPEDLGVPLKDVEVAVNEFILQHMFPESEIIQSYTKGDIKND